MTTTMRVRELSAELGLSNKELLHILREENIPVKSHMSGLTDEQAENIRAKVKQQANQQASQETMTSSGIIVRRKRGQRTRAHEAESTPREQRTESAPPGQEEVGKHAGPEAPPTEQPATAEPSEEQPSPGTEETFPQARKLSEQPETAEYEPSGTGSTEQSDEESRAESQAATFFESEEPAESGQQPVQEEEKSQPAKPAKKRRSRKKKKPI